MLDSHGAERAACDDETRRTERTGDLFPAFFLNRLARLRNLERQWRSRIDAPPPRLLSHALYSTYTDCVRLGQRAEAQRLLGTAAHED
jgi:hypothetical protein